MPLDLQAQIALRGSCTRAGDASSHGGLTVMSALFALGQIVATPGGPARKRQLSVNHERFIFQGLVFTQIYPAQFTMEGIKP